MNILKWTVIAMLLCIAASSCKKEPGTGGKATISGKAFHNLYDHNGKKIDREEAREEDVFIIYGTNAVYNDNMDTHLDGSYQFNFLREGNYSIFAYSDCKSCPSRKESVLVRVDITSGSGTFTAPDLELRKDVNISSGTSTIRGKVVVNKYNASGQLISSYAGMDERVFIVYDTDSVYFDDMRTSDMGEYEFRKLIFGTYRIYAFSDCLSCASGKETKSVNDTIKSKNQIINAPDITIEDRP